MAKNKKSVFLSYRRLPGTQAHFVRSDLMAHRFDVYMDVMNLGSGPFEPELLREIETRRHFVVLLEPGWDDRITESDDCFRHEIAHALQTRRNVVPILFEGAAQPGEVRLPVELVALRRVNYTAYYHAYPHAATAAIRERFLHAVDHESAAARPGQVPGPRLLIKTVGAERVLQWSDCPGAVRYQVKASHGGITMTIHDGPADVRHLPAGGLGSYRVRARYPAGVVSVWSNEVSNEKQQSGWRRSWFHR